MAELQPGEDLVEEGRLQPGEEKAQRLSQLQPGGDVVAKEARFRPERVSEEAHHCSLELEAPGPQSQLSGAC